MKILNTYLTDDIEGLCIDEDDRRLIVLRDDIDLEGDDDLYKIKINIEDLSDEDIEELDRMITISDLELYDPEDEEGDHSDHDDYIVEKIKKAFNTEDIYIED